MTRERRFLAGGSAIIVALLVLGRGGPAWAAWVNESRAAAAEQERAAADANTLLTHDPMTTDSLAARNTRFLALAPTLLSGHGAAGAGATLVAVISTAATAANISLGAVQLASVADTNRAHAFLRVRAHGDATGDVAGVTRFLAALEHGPLRLMVSTLTITQPEAAAPPSRPESLHAEFTVDGVALNPW